MGGREPDSADVEKALADANAALERRYHQLALFDDIAHSAHILHEVRAILDRGLDDIVSKLEFEWGAIYVDSGSARPELHGYRNTGNTFSVEIERRRQQLGAYLTAEVIRTGHALVVPDLHQDDRFRGLWDAPEQPRTYGLFPLRMMQAAASPAVIEIVTRPGRPLEPPDVQMMTLLAHAIGNAVDHALLLADANQREREMNLLYQLGGQIYACRDLPDIADTVAQGARELLQADLALVALLDENKSNMVIEGTSGDGIEALRGARIPTGDDEMQKLLAAGRPLLTNFAGGDLPDNRRLRRDVTRRGSFFLAAPLRQCDDTVGSVSVIAHGRGPFSEHDRELLDWLSQKAAVAVANVRLSHNTLNLAVLEERDRLAREMHDNIAQTLGYIKMSTATAESQLEQGDIVAAQQQLRDVERAAREAYTDVRQGIFNLRTAVAAGAEFLPTLREYLSEYQAHYGVATCLTVQDGLTVALANGAALQVGRVIQEALANVRKHARASEVSIEIDQVDGNLRIILTDDGTGFEPTSVPPGGGRQLGLEIMRERITGIGGQFDILSRPGEGTRVIILIEHRT